MFGPGGPGRDSGCGVIRTIGLPVVRSFPPPRAPFSYPTIGTFYVDSVAGGNQYPYSSWAWAARALGTIDGVDAPGSTIYVDDGHNESVATGGATTYTWAGTSARPTRILCVDKTSGEPPANLSTGGTLTHDASGRWTLSSANASGVGGYAYVYGLTFKTSDGGSLQDVISCGDRGTFDHCNFEITDASGNTARIAFYGTWLDCFVKFGHVNQTMRAEGKWSGGGISAGSSTPLSLISQEVYPVLLEDLDLSVAAATMNLADHTVILAVDNEQKISRWRNIKLPAAWSGAVQATPDQLFNSVVELNAGGSAGTPYILRRTTQYGDVYSETTIVRTGGASDGATPLSWKLVSGSGAGIFPVGALLTGEFVIWNDLTGSSRTITVEVVYDSLTNLQNDELWLEVRYYGAAGNPQGTLVSSAMANVLSTPADLTVSAAAWTTTGMVNPNTDQLQVTFTPQLNGFFIATVKLCKASTTVYVDPMMSVS